MYIQQWINIEKIIPRVRNGQPVSTFFPVCCQGYLQIHFPSIRFYQFSDANLMIILDPGLVRELSFPKKPHFSPCGNMGMVIMT